MRHKLKTSHEPRLSVVASAKAEVTSNVFVAVMTGKGTGAIATVQLFGDSAETIIKKIFKLATAKPLTLKTSEILLGTICNDTTTIDQVTIGCEGPHNFAINCHGNPLIVEMIMKLLAKEAVKPVTAEQLLAKILSAQKNLNTIAIEAILAQPKAKTIQGTKIIANQYHGLPGHSAELSRSPRGGMAKPVPSEVEGMAVSRGLSSKAEQWQQNINKISLKRISAEADEILKNSRTAKLIIFGCKVAIVGPPNTGKSTLLNCLAGRQKAIVTDIEGTTRDWVGAQCRIDPLYVELFDTAGLDEKLVETSDDIIGKKSQQKSVEILQQADVVLLVLDNSRTVRQLDKHLLEKISSTGFQPVHNGWPFHPVLTVLNKSDLSAKFDISELPKKLNNSVLISAKFGAGIDNLCDKIRQICNVADFDLHTPVCFTDRQENLLEQLKNAKSTRQADSIISELLNGQVQGMP